jgi:hypothetical protein
MSFFNLSVYNLGSDAHTIKYKEESSTALIS